MHADVNITDRMTSFFHAKARERERVRTNRIVTLKKPDGTYISSQAELESLATNF
jgi:hypothetical protein